MIFALWVFGMLVSMEHVSLSQETLVKAVALTSKVNFSFLKIITLKPKGGGNFLFIVQELNLSPIKASPLSISLRFNKW